MAVLRKINSRAPTVNNSGFGSNSQHGGRYFQKNGRANLKKTGVSFLDGISWYHTMLEMHRWKFLLVIFAAYLVINLLFAGIYLLIGLDKITSAVADSSIGQFGEAFFFSTQTFTTVGYGRLAPTGFLMSFTASFEALIGLLSFALATGLFYGRFSRPQAFLKFSRQAIIAPYKNTVAFMFRLAAYKSSDLSDAEVKLTLALSVEENGTPVNRFFPLTLEIDKINALSMNWTLVHPIDEASPFFGLSHNDLIASRAEVLVFFKAFDDTFSATVVDRTSYCADEIEFGARFLPMYHRNNSGGTTILELDKISATVPADISYTTMLNLNLTPENTTPDAN